MNGTAGVTGGTFTLTDTGTVGQNSGAAVTVTNLELGAGAAGTYSLGVVANAVTNLVANTGSGTGSVALNNGANNLSISNSLNDTGGTSRSGVTTGTLALTDTGTVSQTGTGAVAATNMELEGSAGTFNLNSATNAVSTLAAFIGSGTINLSNGATSLTIGTVGVQGVTAGTLTITDTGSVNQSQAISANLDLLGSGGSYLLAPYRQ